MSTVMDEDIKRWTSRRKSALVMEIFQGKTTVAEAMLELRARKKLESLLEDEK